MLPPSPAPLPWNVQMTMLQVLRQSSEGVELGDGGAPGLSRFASNEDLKQTARRASLHLTAGRSAPDEEGAAEEMEYNVVDVRPCFL